MSAPMRHGRRGGSQAVAGDNPQAQHYDRILEAYDRHYYDAYSNQYRERFILAPLLRGVDLTGQRVADLASGSGETSLFLARTFPGVRCTGFDVSPEACRKYEEKTARPARVFDLMRGGFEGEPFDAAIIMGGLHHCAAGIPSTLHTIASMLRPGGIFLLFEPNREFFLESVRRAWYRLDDYFDASNETALAHGELRAAGAEWFDCRHVAYFGGPAFFLVYNSLVFRLPSGVKRAMAPALLEAERVYNRLPSKWLFASFVAQWVRRDGPAPARDCAPASGPSR